MSRGVRMGGEEPLAVAAAREEILAACSPLPGEQVELSAALGRALLAKVVSGRRLPPWDNSAMDGYAVRAGDLSEAGAALRVVGTVAAGAVAARPLRAGEALRIMTGAPLPEGADAVVMREEAEERPADGDPGGGDGPGADGGGAPPTVRFRLRPAPGDHVRRAGEDVAPGQEVLAAGAALGPGELGLLAALGRTVLVVHRRPVVAIVSTGDELVPPDVPPGPGQIVGSNSFALSAQVREAGAVPLVLPLVPDDRGALRAALAAALRADVVLSSGGVSVGEFDYVKETLAELGVAERFWQVAMKPGKPLSFGVYAPAAAAPAVPVFGLPGNPASSMVSFELFVRPALRRLLGLSGAALLRPLWPARLLAPLSRDRRRPHFLRALVTREPGAAQLLAHPLQRQGSGMLRSMVGINALLEVPPGDAPLPAGAEVPAHLLAPL